MTSTQQATGDIDLGGYQPTDTFFGPPYIDADEQWENPPHRMIHGGFEGTDTRFRFHFPPPNVYRGRLLAPILGGNGGSEDGFTTELVSGTGSISSAFRRGALMMQSNQGHIGETLDPKAGEDPTVYAYRATNESARLARFVAEQIYGEAPHHCYVYGGSGGGARSPNCFENGPDVWDGALPFCGAASVGGEPDQRLTGGPIAFTSMLNVQRVLGDKLAVVVDATAPGGSGDPYHGLTVVQRQELSTLYKLGFPRGDEPVIGSPLGMMWWWAAHADLLYEQVPSYFSRFFTEPGYAGYDDPGVVADRIDRTVKVLRVLTGREVLEDPRFDGQEHEFFRGFAGVMGSLSPEGTSLPVVVELEDVGEGYRLGSGIRIGTGEAAGRQLYAEAVDGNFYLVEGHDINSNLRLRGVVPGDEVHVDNSGFLAYCYRYRHFVQDTQQFESLCVDGTPIFPQHPQMLLSPLTAVNQRGIFSGKMIWVQMTHDYALWPIMAIAYHRGVRELQGEDGERERFRMRWAEHAEHGPPDMVGNQPGRQPNTWLINYGPIIEQTLDDLIAWVEDGVEPNGTNYSYKDGVLTLPETAVERGGIQPVVRVTANGGSRADVTVGEDVTVSVRAEVPPGAGTVVSVDWDFDGEGTYPLHDDRPDGTLSTIDLSTTHSYDRPGTYYVTALVRSHRQGDLDDTTRHVPNLAQARVVVRQ
jgi:hypothetical protein